MMVFLSVNGQQIGPYSLESVHKMNRVGSLANDTYARPTDAIAWSTLDAFLSKYPLVTAELVTEPQAPSSKLPSRWRGFGAGLGIAILGGGVLAGVTVVTGALITLLWWAIGWSTGYAAKSAARTEDQGIGFLAFVAAFVGIFVSFAGFDEHKRTVLIPGGFLLLGCFIGSLWLAFRTASTKDF